MSGPQTPSFASLTGDDVPLLHSFRCGRLDEPWSLAIEAELRETLPGDLSDGRADALGLWAATTLVGVVAWRSTDVLPVRQVLYLAVSLDHRNKGFGRLLKQRVIDDARTAGLRAVTSRVHDANFKMLGLNERLGAVIEQPDDDGSCGCTLVL